MPASRQITLTDTLPAAGGVVSHGQSLSKSGSALALTGAVIAIPISRGGSGQTPAC
jgi:hypothetical protein